MDNHRKVKAMYPIIRMAYQMAKYRNAPTLGLFDTHISHHICMPWDIDPWMELNNGRTLTLFDLGRISASVRNNVSKSLKKSGHGMAVAGASVRYRKRITVFQKIEMHTRSVGYDERFFYMEQSMWNAQGDCANHILLRAAITKKGKMVPPQQFVDVCGERIQSPPLPEWTQAWIDADQLRPWPPMQD